MERASIPETFHELHPEVLAKIIIIVTALALGQHELRKSVQLPGFPVSRVEAIVLPVAVGLLFFVQTSFQSLILFMEQTEMQLDLHNVKVPIQASMTNACKRLIITSSVVSRSSFNSLEIQSGLTTLILRRAEKKQMPESMSKLV